MYLRKIIFVFTLVLLTKFSFNTCLLADVDLLGLNDVPAEGVAVIDMDSGRILYGKNEKQKMAMASTTKIMTALITLEQPNLDSFFKVDSDAIKIEGTSMGLRENDKVSLRSLAVGMLLPSGNDAAEAAAIRIAGSRQDFLSLMNDKAAEFGCKNTHFATTSGLDDDKHYSCAIDMAKITRHALMNSDFADICKQKYQTVKFGDPPYDRTLKNHNKLLKNYDFCIGVKTGFTDNAGKCLVSAAKKDGVGLIVVTLKSSDIFGSHLDIYEKAFEKLSKYKPNVKLPINTVKVVGGEIVSVPVEKNFDTEISVIKGEENLITHKIKIKKFLFAPINKGNVIGEIDYYLDNQKVAVEPITTVMDVNPEKHKSIWERLLK